VALSDKIVGMHFRYPDHYEVGREKVREYAEAVKNDDPAFFEDEAAAELGYGGLLAPLTFISVFGYQAQAAFFASANVEVQDMKIVQVDQVLKFLKPIKVGDCLYCDVYVDSIRQSFGTQMIVTKNLVTNADGELVQETYTTLVGRSDGEGEEGFSHATA
jgi:meromycolic acid (3R)-3-hydroxyacyl-[acyl-carrier protein] dehydratase HadA